jgi:hypothetical protein
LENLKYNVNLLPIGEPGVTRRMKPIEYRSAIPLIQFYPQNITLVGGAAINVYDFILGANRSQFMQKGTTDLDLVWWPDVITSIFQKTRGGTTVQIPHTVVSSSDIFEVLANNVKLALTGGVQIFINQYRHLILNEILPKYNIHKYTTAGSLIKNDIHVRHTSIAGAYNIGIDLIFEKHLPGNQTDKTTVRIGDISIHDGASSQESNTLEYQHTDIIYSNMQLINYIPFTSGTIHVPYITRLIDQQKRALENRVKMVWNGRRAELMTEKAQTHYRRLRYILNILHFLAFSADLNRTTRVKSVLKNAKIISNASDVYYQLMSYLTNSEHAIVACPWEYNTCLTSNKDLLRTLCEQNKSLNPELCRPPAAEPPKVAEVAVAEPQKVAELPKIDVAEPQKVDELPKIDVAEPMPAAKSIASQLSNNAIGRLTRKNSGSSFTTAFGALNNNNNTNKVNKQSAGKKTRKTHRK